jgi:hypothetical protein
MRLEYFFLQNFFAKQPYPFPLPDPRPRILSSPPPLRRRRRCPRAPSSLRAKVS